MGLAEILAILLVVAVIVALMGGYPVALTLGGVSLVFALIGDAAGVMNLGFLGALPQRIAGVMMNDVLLAIPLFIFMGVMLERSKIAEELLETMGRSFGALRGGLGYSVIIVGALLAASTGVVGATTVTMGLVMLPAMLRHRYDPRLAAGAVAASATLAQIIPPSTVLVVLGDQLNNAYQTAQLAKGVFAPASVSVGDLFAGALLPGLLLVALYLVFLIVVAITWPEASPAMVPLLARAGQNDADSRNIIGVLVAPVLLIVAVLGSILGGLATPTEAAAVGAVGATLLSADRIGKGPSWPIIVAGVAILAVLTLAAVVDLRIGRAAPSLFDVLGIWLALALMAVIAAGVLLALVRLWRADVLIPVMASTAHITSMIFVILIGATLFSLVFRGFGGDDMVHRALSDLPGGVAGAVLAVMITMFLLGFVMDVFEIVFVVVPIVAPVLLAMPGVDPVWLGIMMAVNLQTSFMHPPLGATLFYLRGVAPPEITTRHIYVGIIPFVVIQLVALVLLWFAPGLATWLPAALYGRP